MTILTRAALAALTLALTPPAATDAAAQSSGGARGTVGVPRLPTVRARPPARPRRPTTQVAVRPAAAGPVRAVANPAPLAARRSDLPDNGEKWADLTPDAANAAPALPVGRGHEGAAVLHVQVLLDRALFSPGMLDGKWGRNTEIAVYWLQAREGLPATGTVDSATYERLQVLAGRPAEIVRLHELTADDVRGPFVQIPANIYEHARLSCSCYESLSEKLTESFHTKSELLRRLNPGVDFDQVTAGSRVHVPAVRAVDASATGQIAELWVSGQHNFLQAVDAQGRILYHFPTTLGSSYDPSPQGDFSVRSVHPNPWWHYQPKILAHVPDDRPDARIPPGPNNSVGNVWIALSAPHYGIHGTKSPETIGYATSAGCVRLTNWDVMFLGRQVPAGTPVRFRDTRREAPAAAPAEPRAPSGPPVLGVRADSVPASPADSAAAPSAPAVPTDSAAAPTPLVPAAPMPPATPAIPPPDSGATAPPA